MDTLVDIMGFTPYADDIYQLDAKAASKEKRTTMKLFSIFKQIKPVVPEAEIWDNPAPGFYNLSEEQEVALAKIPREGNGFISLGEVTRNLLNQQVQYISFHFDGSADYPILTNDLQVEADGYNYHGYKIHHGDVIEFLARLRAYRSSKGLPFK